MYLELFITILQDINDSDYLNDLIDGIFDTLFGDDKQTSKSDKSLYIQLCNKNKLSDNRIGFCECVTMFELSNLITDRVVIVISKIIEMINEDKNEEKMYPLIQCLYSIAKRNISYALPHIDYLKEMSQSVKNKKLLFKMKDIFDLV